MSNPKYDEAIRFMADKPMYRESIELIADLFGVPGATVEADIKVAKHALVNGITADPVRADRKL
jgi:hypothetical protein